MSYYIKDVIRFDRTRHKLLLTITSVYLRFTGRYYVHYNITTIIVKCFIYYKILSQHWSWVPSADFSLWKTFSSGCFLHFRVTPLTPFSCSLFCSWQTDVGRFKQHSPEELNAVFPGWFTCVRMMAFTVGLLRSREELILSLSTKKHREKQR